MIRGYHGTTRQAGRQIQRYGFKAGQTCFTVDDRDMGRRKLYREHRDRKLDLTAFQMAQQWSDGTVVEVNLEKLPGFTLEWIIEDVGDGGSSWEAQVPVAIPPSLIVLHLKVRPVAK